MFKHKVHSKGSIIVSFAVVYTFPFPVMIKNEKDLLSK